MRNMSNQEIGFRALVNVIGVDFYRSHKDNAVFSWGEEDEGLYCFLGITLHPEKYCPTLAAKRTIGIYMPPAMSLKMGLSLWMSADFRINGDIDYCH